MSTVAAMAKVPTEFEPAAEFVQSLSSSRAGRVLGEHAANFEVKMKFGEANASQLTAGVLRTTFLHGMRSGRTRYGLPIRLPRYMLLAALSGECVLLYSDRIDLLRLMLLTGGHPMYATKVLTALERLANWLDERKEPQKSALMTYVLPWQEGIGSGFWDVRTLTHVPATERGYLDGQRFFNSMDGEIKFGTATDTEQSTVEPFVHLGIREVDVLRGCLTAQAVDPAFLEEAEQQQQHGPRPGAGPGATTTTNGGGPGATTTTTTGPSSSTNNNNGGNGGGGGQPQKLNGLTERGQEAAEQFLRRTLDSLKVDRAKLIKELRDKDETYATTLEEERTKFRKESFDTIKQAKCAREVAEHARDAAVQTATEHQRKAAEARTALAELKAENTELQRSIDTLQRTHSKQEKALNSSVAATSKQLSALKKQHDALVGKANSESKALKAELDAVKARLATGETISEGRKKRLDVLESQVKQFKCQNRGLEGKINRMGLEHSQTLVALVAERDGLKTIASKLQHRLGSVAIVALQRRFRLVASERSLAAARVEHAAAILAAAAEAAKSAAAAEKAAEAAAVAIEKAAAGAEAAAVAEKAAADKEPAVKEASTDASFITARHASTTTSSTGVGTHTHQFVQTDATQDDVRPTCVAEASRAAHIALKQLIELSQAPRSDYVPEFLAHNRPTCYSGMAREAPPQQQLGDQVYANGQGGAYQYAHMYSVSHSPHR
jgi:hypothetical protein